MSQETDKALGAGKICFIVSPIGDELASLGTVERANYEQSIAMWAKVFQPACEAFGLTAVRADKIADPGDIPDQIFAYLRDSDVVIADLSGANPNVMYELGLRHSREAITLQVGENERLPFDVTTIRTIKFNRDEAGLIDLRNRLVESLRAALTLGKTELRATAVFANGSRPDINADAERSAEPDDVDDTDDGPGVVELLAEAEQAIVHISEVLGDAVARNQEIGAITQDAADEMNRPTNSSFAARLQISRALATSLEGPARELERLANEYFLDVERIDYLVRFVVTQIENGELQASDMEEFLTDMRGLVTAAEGSLVGVTSMRDAARGLRKMSSSLKVPSEIIEQALNRQIGGTRKVMEWGALIDGVTSD